MSFFRRLFLFLVEIQIKEKNKERGGGGCERKKIRVAKKRE